MDGVGFRNVWISLAAMLPIAVVGLIVLRDNPEAKGWLTLGLLVCVVSLRHFLDERKLRRNRDRG